MFQRLLSFLGFMPSFPSLPGQFSASSSQDSMEVDGSATVSFVPGRKDPLSASELAESGETPDEQRARITERDLVWPGKTDTIHIGNPEGIAYRYDMTLTDLDPALYVRRPAVGGVWQPEGGTLLQPGEEADFEILYVAPPPGDKARLRTFSVVLTQFDPRRSADPGLIVAEQPSRWVALPGPGDLAITASPPQTTTRPWRRQALVAVQLVNRSFLPSSVELAVVRAQSKEALVKEPETVATVSQSLPAKTPGVWNILLNSPATRGSYLATVTGTTRVTEQIAYPLAIPKPVLVRYVPWLRMGRDWVFLAGVILFLLWLIWGVPVKKQPVVAVTLAFESLTAGQMPDGASLKDLNPTMTLLDEDNTPLAGQPPIAGSFNNHQLVFKGPERLYGYRWPLGWNRPSRVSQRYQLNLAPKDGKEAEFSRYTLPAPSDTASLDVTKATSIFGAWKVEQTIQVVRSPGTVVLINIGDLGGLKKKNIRLLTVNFELDGQSQPPRILPLYSDGHNGFKPLPLDITDQVPLGKNPLLHVSATALGVPNDNSVESVPVKRQRETFTLPEALTFPATLPLTPEQLAAAQNAEAKAKQKQDNADKAKLGKKAVGTKKPEKKAEKQNPKRNNRGEKKAGKEPEQKNAGLPIASALPTTLHGQSGQVREAAALTPEDYLLRNQFQNAIDEVKAQDTPYAHAIQAIAYAQIATSEAKSGQIKEANAEVSLADSGAQTPKDRALVLVAKGWIAFQQRQWGAASDYFNKAVNQDPHLFLAEVSLNAGQPDAFKVMVQLNEMLKKPGLSKAAKLDIMTQYKAASKKELD